MFGLDALASAANRVNSSTVSMPIYYGKYRETEDEAKLVWDIEGSSGALTELEVVNLKEHLENRARFGRWNKLGFGR